MQKHSRQDDGNEVDHEMADHVRDQVASPEIDEHQDCAESEGKDDVNEPIGSMPEAEDQQRDDSGPVAVQSKQLKPFDGVAAIEKFLDHACTQDDQDDQPERKLRQCLSHLTAFEMGEAGNDGADGAAEHSENCSPQDRVGDEDRAPYQ